MRSKKRKGKKEKGKEKENGKETKMGTKVLHKEDSFRLLLPKLDMTINTPCNDVIGCRHRNMRKNIPMHVTEFIHLTEEGKGFVRKRKSRKEKKQVNHTRLGESPSTISQI